MSLLLVVNSGVEQAFKLLLSEAAPEIDVELFSEVQRSEKVTMAATWNHAPGIWDGFPGLQLVTSFGVGADHLIADKTIPESVHLSRLVDPRLSEAMADYVLLAVLAHRRNYRKYLTARAQHIWTAPDPAPLDKKKVAVLGLGSMGSAVAVALHRRKLSVCGWSRTKDTGLPFPCFAGESELAAAVGGADYLVCVLPLDSSTEGILSFDLFKLLAPGAYVINVGRGGHLNEADLIEAIESGILSGACLDVVSEEPLPPEHPLWNVDSIDITPHISAKPSRAAILTHLIESYRALQYGELPIGIR